MYNFYNSSLSCRFCIGQQTCFHHAPFNISRQTHFTDELRRRDFKFPIYYTTALNYLAVEYQRDSMFSKYRNNYLAVTQISAFLIYRSINLAVVHQRAVSLPKIQKHLHRRCTSTRFQFSLDTDASTLPLYIGEISVFFI